MTKAQDDHATSQAERLWRASPAYTDMLAALREVGWTSYEEANAARTREVKRWRRFQLVWERRMQARIGISHRTPPHPNHPLRHGEPKMQRDRRRVESRTELL